MKYSTVRPPSCRAGLLSEVASAGLEPAPADEVGPSGFAALLCRAGDFWTQYSRTLEPAKNRSRPAKIPGASCI